VAPLLAARCASCHGGDQPSAGLDLTSWEGVTEGSRYGEAVIAYDPDRSLALRLATMLPEGLPSGYAWRHAVPFDVFREAHALPEAEVAVLRRWVAAGAPGPRGEVPFAEASGRVYVATQDAGLVTVIDPDRLVVARTVRFDAYGGTAATPHHLTVEPDGSALYVTLIGAQRVVRLDAATLEVEAELDVRPLNATFKPGMLALDPTSDRLWLSRSISDLSGGRSVMVLDRRAMTAEEVLVPYTRPHPIGLTRDGRRVLSGSLADNLVATLDTRTFDFSAPLRVDETQTPLMQYAVAPDGRTAAITGQFSNRLYILDLADPEAPTVRAAVPVGQEPWYPAYSPDGRRVYVPNHRSNTLSVVDLETLSVTATVSDPRFAMPHGVVASPDGRYLFVTNANLTHVDVGPAPPGALPEAPPVAYQPRYPLDRSGDGRVDNLYTGHVAVIDAQTLEVVRVIEVEDFPSGIAVWQRGYPPR
jgi:YVTN family beta-propeller protein